MKSRWPQVPFSEIFKRVDRQFHIDNEEKYNRVGVRWYGKGAFIRDSKLGVGISRKQQWRVEIHDIIYNKLFAWKGAFAVADERIHGNIASDKFPTYKHNPEKVNLDYLRYYFQTEDISIQAEELSRGAAAISKLTLNPPKFMELTIPLPTLGDQNKLVEHIDGLISLIENAQRLREITINKINILERNLLEGFLSQFTYDFVPLKEFLAEKLRNGLSIPASAIGEYGDLFAKVGIVNSGIMNPIQTKRVKIDLDEDSTYWMKPGDIFVSRGNSLELVGRAAVYDGIPERCAFPDLLIRIRVDKAKANPNFISYYFHSGLARKYTESVATGTSPSMKKISQPKLLKMPIPQIPLLEQQNIVSNVIELYDWINNLKTRQTKTQQELDMARQSVLNKAFLGELSI